MNSKAKGQLSEASILKRFLQKGIPVLLPFGDNEPYDMVIDEGERGLKKIQIKSGRVKNNAIIFNTATSINHNIVSKDRKSEHYKGKVDYLGIYCAELDKCYLLPVLDFPNTKGSLRLAPTKNNQTKNVKWAVDYEI